MATALITDVHANLAALVAVLADLAGVGGAASVHCLGDVVGYGPFPNECATLVRETCGATVMGNHDAFVGGSLDCAHTYEAVRKLAVGHRLLLEPANLKWLRALPMTHREGEVALCHASPRRPGEYEYLVTEEHAAELAPLFDELAPVTFTGHTHQPAVFRVTRDGARACRVDPEEGLRLFPDHEGKYVVVCPAVGQPRDGDNRAGYALYEERERVVRFRRVEYAIEDTAGAALASGVEPNFAHRLFLGV